MGIFQKLSGSLVSAFFGLLLIFVFLGCAQSKLTAHSDVYSAIGAVDVNSTITCYNKINQLSNSDIEEPNWELGAQGKFNELATAADKQSESFRSVAIALRELQMKGVDAAVTELALNFSEFFDFYASHLQNTANLAHQLKTFDQEYHSAAALVETVLRGAKGDPFGKAIESRRDRRQIEARLEDDQKETKMLLDFASEMGRRNARVKIYLQQTYGAE
jgi:hypothetical protein